MGKQKNNLKLIIFGTSSRTHCFIGFSSYANKVVRRTSSNAIPKQNHFMSGSFQSFANGIGDTFIEEELQFLPLER